MTVALGINTAHDASVAVCSSEAGILCAIQEERITRIKHHYGFPARALETALRQCGLEASDIDIVTFPTHMVFFPEQKRHRVVLADGRRLTPHEARRRGGWKGQVRGLVDGLGLSALELVVQRARLTSEIKRSWGEFAPRHYLFHRDLLADLGLLGTRVRHYYVAHHRAHAASAFRSSGMERATVVTADGKGDGLSATIYRGGPDGRLELLRSSRAADSLGAFYQAATEALGFIPVDGEYKTMGLAALGGANGEPNPFEGTVRVQDGVLRSQHAWTYRDFNQANPAKAVPNPISSVTQTDLFKPLLQRLSPEQFAFFAQDHCERVMLQYVQDALRISGVDALAGAGGVMLNVKANALVRDSLEPCAFFVFPDSADSGLAAGAALEALYQEGAAPKEPLFLPYLGHSFDQQAMDEAVARFSRSHALVVSEGDPHRLAEHLAAGKVVGTFQGRLEMGPRALGNRSVLADPRSSATKDRINSILKGREWFVPFAPAVLEEDAEKYWSGPRNYRYMTFSVAANEHAKQVVPAVVHVDGTMRPEVVSTAFNPWLHSVLQAFKERTGVGVLINTSFNRHGLPIVGSPDDALEHLVQGWVDAVVIGSRFVERAEDRP